MKKIGFSAILLAVFTFGTFSTMAVPPPEGNCPYLACVNSGNGYDDTCTRKPFGGYWSKCLVDRDYAGRLCYKDCQFL